MSTIPKDDPLQMQLEYLVNQLRKATSSRFAIVVAGYDNDETRCSITMPEAANPAEKDRHIKEALHSLIIVAASVLEQNTGETAELMIKTETGTFPALDDDVGREVRWSANHAKF